MGPVVDEGVWAEHEWAPASEAQHEVEVFCLAELRVEAPHGVDCVAPDHRVGQDDSRRPPGHVALARDGDLVCCGDHAAAFVDRLHAAVAERCGWTV